MILRFLGNDLDLLHRSLDCGFFFNKHIFRNFPPPIQLINALNNAVHKDKFPYNISYGKYEARVAVAEYSKHQGKVEADDIILTSGCSHAMEM